MPLCQLNPVFINYCGWLFNVIHSTLTFSRVRLIISFLKALAAQPVGHYNDGTYLKSLVQTSRVKNFNFLDYRSLTANQLDIILFGLHRPSKGLIAYINLK